MRGLQPVEVTNFQLFRTSNPPLSTLKNRYWELIFFSLFPPSSWPTWWLDQKGAKTWNPLIVMKRLNIDHSTRRSHMRMCETNEHGFRDACPPIDFSVMSNSIFFFYSSKSRKRKLVYVPTRYRRACDLKG